MATTTQKIEKALSIMKAHDWYWCMAEYTNPAYCNAYASMRTFVEVVASITDNVIVKALRDLWMATYNYVHATMFGSNDKAKAESKAKEAELMAILSPSYAMAA